MSNDTVKQEDGIERFTTVGYSEYADNGMRPMFDGEWVRYSDHLTALATVRREVWNAAIEIAKAEAFERRMAYCVVEALEVATEKGDTNG